MKCNYLDNTENESDILYKKTTKWEKRKMTKCIINLQIEDKSIQMELYTGSSLSSTSLNDYKQLHFQQNFKNSSTKHVNIYTREIVKPFGIPMFCLL